MPAFLDRAAVDRALPYAALIGALRETFAEGLEAPVRHHHEIPRAGKDPATLLLMPAWRPDREIGVKLLTIFPGNEAATGLPSVQAVYLLFDGASGAPRALLDGTALTLRRTAAASALATDFLAREDSSRLLMIGAGALAPHLVRAHAVVRPIRQVMVWNRTPERARRLAGELAREGFEARAVTDRIAALQEADIVSCATMSTTPLVPGDRVRPGTHVDLVGAFRPDMRESDDALMRRAEVYVDTTAGALAEAGDIIQALRSGALSREAIRGDLYALCRGRCAGRREPAAITVFKSVGSAVEDLAAAALVAASVPG